MTADFPVRALELHASVHIWDPARLTRVIDEMTELGFTTLILHEVQGVERLVYPGRYFGADPEDGNIYERYRSTYERLYRYTPGRRSKPYLYMETLRWVIRRCAERGIEVYLNNKELFFPDVILEFEPELMRDGVLCPTHPFWFEFLETKYRELFEDLPGLRGVVTAPGTGESKLSISSNRCACDRCAATAPSDWYAALLAAIRRPAEAAGKRVVVRDFVFDKKTQDDLAAAFRELPSDVTICIKNTPHDYYPTFPDNPVLGAVGDHPQWVEFDVMGQYYGWGIAPAAMLADSRARLAHARASGVEGVLVRVDWESLDGHSVFDTPNLVNLYALAGLARDAGLSDETIYERWLVGAGLVEPGLAGAELRECVRWAQSVFDPTWDVVRGALYADDCVFSDSTTTPVGLDHAFWLAEVKNSLRDWDPAKERALEGTPERVRSLIAEKERAIEGWRALRDAVAMPCPGLREGVHEDLVWRFDVFGVLVEGYRHLLACAISARHVVETRGDPDPEVVRILEAARRDLDAYIGRVGSDPSLDWFPASHLINAQRLQAFADDVTHRVDEAARSRREGGLA